MDERGVTFECFGATCAVFAAGDAADAAIAHAKQRLLGWHAQFSRFDPASELSRLNADPRAKVAVSPLLARLAQTAVGAAELTEGLVDAMLATEIERAGYRTDIAMPLPLPLALRLAPARRRASSRPGAPWRELGVDGRVIHRPPGLGLDSGGLAKGLFADVLASELARLGAFAIDRAGGPRVRGGGRRG